MFTRTPEPARPGRANQISYSPDGQYIAIVYLDFEGEAERQSLIVANSLGEQVFRTDYRPGAGDPHPLLVLRGWSHDSSVMYYYRAWSPDGGDLPFWWQGHDLMRVAVAEGEERPLIRGTGWLSFAFSPDQKFLAYAREEDSPSVIAIMDMTIGGIRREVVPPGSTQYLVVGDIRWAPSGKGIVYQAVSRDRTIRTIFLDPGTITQILLKECPAEMCYLEGWVGDSVVRFLNWPSMRIEEFQITSGVMNEVGTATPSPYP